MFSPTRRSLADAISGKQKGVRDVRWYPGETGAAGRSDDPVINSVRYLSNLKVIPIQHDTVKESHSLLGPGIQWA